MDDKNKFKKITLKDAYDKAIGSIQKFEEKWNLYLEEEAELESLINDNKELVNENPDDAALNAGLQSLEQRLDNVRKEAFYGSEDEKKDALRIFLEELKNDKDFAANVVNAIDEIANGQYVVIDDEEGIAKLLETKPCEDDCELCKSNLKEAKQTSEEILQKAINLLEKSINTECDKYPYCSSCSAGYGRWCNEANAVKLLKSLIDDHDNIEKEEKNCDNCKWSDFTDEIRPGQETGDSCSEVINRVAEEIRTYIPNAKWDLTYCDNWTPIERKEEKKKTIHFDLPTDYYENDDYLLEDE